MESQHADIIMSIPDLVARVNMLEHRLMPSLQESMTGFGDAIAELQRRIGDPKGFSLKGKRALAPDETKGLAA